MSQCYRELEDDEDVRNALYPSVGLIPIEVDEWHPASEPPKPEDFHPTGEVLWAWKNGWDKWQFKTGNMYFHKRGEDGVFWLKITLPIK